MRKLLICALALGGFAASAQAADLSVDSLKDPLPDTITSHGVTIYGTIDVGYGYQTNAVPASGAFYVGSDWTIYGSKFANGPQSQLTNNALEQSKIGVKIEEGIGEGWVAIGKLETGFDPAFGEISDACASLLRNNGKLYSQMDVNGDGSRCGQAFNGEAYAGISNASYGTLKVGRQNSLVNDGMGVYDPMGGSYAFSLIGYSGTPGAGIGSTETARWDDAVKYIYQYGPLHAAGMFTSGGQDTPLMEHSYGGNVGGAYKGFSLDGYYTKENGAVGLGSWPNAAYGTACAGTQCNELKGTITDNEAWDVMAKYTFELGGGFKDEPGAKVTFFGGYQNVDMTNPDHVQSYWNGYNTEGGYQFYTGTSTTGQAFGTGATKNLQTEWAGAKYETGPWAFTGAYYHWSQGDYVDSKQHTCAYNNTNIAGSTKVNDGVGKQIGGNCSGALDEGSFLIDYTFTKHFDVYAGVTYSDVGGGLASGFLQDNNTAVATGMRLKF